MLLPFVAFELPTATRAAVECYDDYTHIATIKNAGSCTGMQGMAMDDTYLYSIKIASSTQDNAFIARTHKETGATTYLKNAATVLTPENATGTMDMVEGETYQFLGQVPNIAAKQVDETVFVAGVYELDGVTYTTGILAYSLGKYCQKIAADNTSDQQAFSAATAVYGYYAKEYFVNL